MIISMIIPILSLYTKIDSNVHMDEIISIAQVALMSCV